jgi:hypothetical protein
MSAPRGNKFAKGHGQGRPSLYRPAFAAQAKTLCERGATNKELAQYFNVDIGTIRQWRMNYQDFFTAVRMGKAVADELVEQALFERATGWGDLPPDVGAIRTWLFNRRPNRWREKIAIERTGGWADRSPDEIKKALVQKMIMWKLVDPRNVPPDLLPPQGMVDRTGGSR